MTDCAELLQFARARRAAPPDLSTQFILSALQGAAGEKDDAAEAETEVVSPSRFCRDPSSQANYGVYRREGAKDSYVIGLYDAGTSVGVHRQPAAGLLGGGSAKDFWIDLSTVSETATIRGFRSLPAPSRS